MVWYKWLVHTACMASKSTASFCRRWRPCSMDETKFLSCSYKTLDVRSANNNNYYFLLNRTVCTNSRRRRRYFPTPTRITFCFTSDWKAPYLASNSDILLPWSWGTTLLFSYLTTFERSKQTCRPNGLQKVYILAEALFLWSAKLSQPLTAEMCCDLFSNMLPLQIAN